MDCIEWKRADALPALVDEKDACFPLSHAKRRLHYFLDLVGLMIKSHGGKCVSVRSPEWQLPDGDGKPEGCG